MKKPSSDTSKDLDDANKFSLIKEKRGTLAIKGAMWSTINTATPTILNSLVFIVTSRYLMPHDFGIVALSVSIVSFASALTPGALGDALIQKFTISSKLLDTVFWICISSAVIIYLILVVASYPIAAYLQQPQISELVPLIGLKLIFDLSATVPNSLIARAMSFHLIATRTIIATMMSAIVCISLLFYGFGILALVVSLLTTSIINCLVTFVGAKWLPKFNFEITKLKEIAKFGIFASGNRFLQIMNLDQILLGALISPTALGIFNFSKKMYQMLHDVLVGSLNSVSYALMASMQNEKEKVKETFLLATFSSSFVAFPAFIGLATIVPELIPFLFGDHWKDAILPTQWFCMFGLMSCIGVIQSSLINSQGKNHWWFYYQLFKQILTLSTIILMHNQSIGTIVMTLTLQTVAIWPITLYMVTKIINMKFSSYFRQFLGPIIAASMMVIIISISGQLTMEMQPIYSIITKILIGGLTYSLFSFALEHKRIKKIIGFIKKRRA